MQRAHNTRVAWRSGKTAAVALTALVAAGLSQPASAGTVTLDFESLTNMEGAHAYLASYGITVVGADPGSGLVAASETVTYGGGVVGAPSGTMYITQAAVNPDGSGTGGAAVPSPNLFTLNFSTGLTDFGFSDSAILLPSINASWTARAWSGLGGTGSLLDTVAFSPASTHPTISFLLSGAGIMSVSFDQTFSASAAFASGNFDDFILTGPGVGEVPEPLSFTLFGAGLLGLGWIRRKTAAGGARAA